MLNLAYTGSPRAWIRQFTALARRIGLSGSSVTASRCNQVLTMTDEELQAYFRAYCSMRKGAYTYISPDNCAFAQYLKDVGFKDPRVSGCAWWAEGIQGQPLPPSIKYALIAGRYTFGDLANRLR